MLGRFPFALRGRSRARRRGGGRSARTRRTPRGTRRERPPAVGPQTLRGIETAEFVAHTIPALEAVDGVRVDRVGAARTYSELTGDPEITVTTVESTDPDWFDLGVIVTIDGTPHPVHAAVHRAVPAPHQAAAGRRALLLARPSRARSAARAPGRGRDARRVGDRAADQPAPGRPLGGLRGPRRPGRAGRVVAGHRRGPARRRTDRGRHPCPPALTAELRPYQRAGFDWLAFLWRHRLGGILADDMGLGKTLQMLALIAHAHESGARAGRSWSSRPTSVMSVWRSEAARFAPGLRVRDDRRDAREVRPRGGRGRGIRRCRRHVVHARSDSTRPSSAAWSGRPSCSTRPSSSRTPHDEAAPRRPRSARRR